MSLAFIACWSPEIISGLRSKKGETHMKLKKKMKRMLEANLMNVILATEQRGLKKLMIHFLETL